MCEKKDFCNVIMPSQDTNLSQFDQNRKFDKAPLVVYVDFAWIIEKIDWCKINPPN